MDRRTFLAAPLAAWTLGAGAAVPAIGFVRSTPAAPFTGLVAAFREGLAEGGLVEGSDVTVEYRYADNDASRLPALVKDVIARDVRVIVGNSQAAEAAKAATSTIPIVFVTADDPVERGLVASMSRPGGNVTGVTFFGAQLGVKRLELLCEIAPAARSVGLLLDPSWPGTAAEARDIEDAARTRGLEVRTVEAPRGGKLTEAFATLRKNGSELLLVAGSPAFTSRAQEIAGLARQARLPAAFDQRAFVVNGGLLSYAGSFAGAYRQAGAYAARIVKGARPSALPVLQPTTFSLSINMKTAKALGLAIPPSVALRADERID
jgi:putative ABC transport system substrate-binding protein